MTTPLPGQLGFGQPPRKNPIIDLARRTGNVEDQLGALWSATGFYPQAVSTSQSSISYPNGGGFSNYASYTITAPVGYTSLLYFLWATAGLTWAPGVAGALVVEFANVASPSVAATGVAGGGQSLTACTAGFSTGFGPGATQTIAVAVDAVGASNASSGNASMQGVLLWMP